MSWTFHLHINGEDRKTVEEKRSPKSFLQESYIEAYAYHRIFPLKKGNQKFGDNRYSPGYSVIGVCGVNMFSSIYTRYEGCEGCVRSI